LQLIGKEGQSNRSATGRSSSREEIATFRERGAKQQVYNRREQSKSGGCNSSGGRGLARVVQRKTGLQQEKQSNSGACNRKNSLSGGCNS
jgi:hypothetical protein